LKELKIEGTVKLMPTRDEMSYPVNEQYIVELYSK
jgi:ribosomal protein S4